jgi:hypothetical protein
MSRKSIGTNPLDALLTVPEEKEQVSYKVTKKTQDHHKVTKPPAAAPVGKQQIAIQLSGDIAERAKNGVYWTRGLTLASFVEGAIEKAITALEKTSVIFDDKTGKPLKDKGEPFPQRLEELKSGRPIK